MSAHWGPAERDKLRVLWGEGKTARQIAFEFGDGRTRNAIIGKVHALGLPARERKKGGGGGHYHEREDGRVRKAYASKGDDCTFSRFVKVRSSRPQEHRHLQLWIPDTKNDSIRRGRSLFHRKGVKRADEVKNVLVSGHSNVKIGRDVRKGKLFRGYWIYTLSLEERHTCPRTCAHWDDCYGNHMPYAKRVTHGPALERQLEVEVGKLMANRVWSRAAHATGILVRLHALGDFYSVEYVELWSKLLDTFPKLAAFGYTARRPGDPIHDAVVRVKEKHGRRFAIRFSDGGLSEDCTVSIVNESERPVDAFVCPEQTWRSDACGKCGLCWNTTKNVAFLAH